MNEIAFLLLTTGTVSWWLWIIHWPQLLSTTETVPMRTVDGVSIGNNLNFINSKFSMLFASKNKLNSLALYICISWLIKPKLCAWLNHWGSDNMLSGSFGWIEPLTHLSTSTSFLGGESSNPRRSWCSERSLSTNVFLCVHECFTGHRGRWEQTTAAGHFPPSAKTISRTLRRL